MLLLWQHIGNSAMGVILPTRRETPWTNRSDGSRPSDASCEGNRPLPFVEPSAGPAAEEILAPANHPAVRHPHDLRGGICRSTLHLHAILDSGHPVTATRCSPPIGLVAFHA